MNKDKEWLKQAIKDNGLICSAKLYDLIDQLDEPEQTDINVGLLKPVIPQFVADYIERAKPRHDSLYQAMEERAGEEVNEWIQAFYNSDKFARAWLYGYEVEEEQKYILSISITHKESNTNYETFLNKRGIFHSMENESFNSEEFNWTEEEIKDLENGEMLFEHFATKVGEMTK